MTRPWILRRPATLTIFGVVAILAISTRSVLLGPDSAVLEFVSTGVDALLRQGDVASLVTSVLFANTGVELIAVLAAIVLVVGQAERLMGAWRVLLAYFVTGVLGGVLGIGLQGAGLLTRGVWSTPPASAEVLHPFTPIFGTLLAASAFAGPLWRRRIRVLGLAALVVLLLYSGQPGDLYRLTGALVGLLLGVLLTRRRAPITWTRSSHHEARTLLAALVAMSAIGPVVAVFRPHGYGILRPLGILFRDPLPAPGAVPARCLALHTRAWCTHQVLLGHLNSVGAIVLTVLPLLILLTAAVGMLYGRRVSAWMAIGVSLLLAVLTAIYYGFLPSIGDPDELVPRSKADAPSLQTVLAVLVPLGVAAAVWWKRRHFTVLPTRRALVISGVAVGGVLVGVCAAYVGIGVLVRGQFTPKPDFFDLLSDLPERFVPAGFLRYRRVDFAPDGPMSRILYDWSGPVVWVTLLIASIACAVSRRRAVSPSEMARVRGLLRAGAPGSISYMATWQGNRYWFSDDGVHAVVFHEGSGVALTLGEPIGPEAGALAAAADFAVWCDDRGLTPAFYAVRESFAAALRARGPWSVAGIGEDTVLRPATFTMRGKRWQDVRSSINRADRLGIRADLTDWGSLSYGRRAQIEAISEEWIAEKRLPELGFTLGGVAELRDPEVRLMLAIGPEGRVEAVTSWLPTWRDGEVIGWTLDFMRRRPESMNGVMEFLIAQVVQAAQQRGLEFVSLSVAPLAMSVGDDEANRVERILEYLGRLLEPAYGFKSLAAFKDKFQPELVPQVLVYPDALALPAISMAVSRAYLPDLSVPALARLLGALRPD